MGFSVLIGKPYDIYILLYTISLRNVENYTVYRKKGV